MPLIFLGCILKASNKVVYADEINRIKIIGKLGHPLHTLHLIECVLVDMSFTKRKLDQGKNALKVISVDGEVLDQDIYFDVPIRLGESVFKSGEKTKMWVYESLENRGFPQKAFQELEIPSFQTSDLHFAFKLVPVNPNDLVKEENVFNFQKWSKEK